MGQVIIDNKTRHGKLIIKGTRVTVNEVLGALIGGMSYEEIEKEYGIKKEDILAAIEYATSLMKDEEIRYFKDKPLE